MRETVERAFEDRHGRKPAENDQQFDCFLTGVEFGISVKNAELEAEVKKLNGILNSIYGEA